MKAPAGYSPRVHTLQETSTDAISKQVPEQLIYFITVREKCKAEFLQGYLVPKSKCTFLVGFERVQIPTDFKWVSLWEIFKPHAATECIPKVMNKGGHDLVAVVSSWSAALHNWKKDCICSSQGINLVSEGEKKVKYTKKKQSVLVCQAQPEVHFLLEYKQLQTSYRNLPISDYQKIPPIVKTDSAVICHTHSAVQDWLLHMSISF